MSRAKPTVTPVVYKIRNKLTGLYSGGGYYPSWTTKGKAWASMGALKGHLALGRSYRFNREIWEKQVANLEVVPFIVSPTEQPAFSVASVYEEKK